MICIYIYDMYMDMYMICIIYLYIWYVYDIYIYDMYMICICYVYIYTPYIRFHDAKGYPTFPFQFPGQVWLPDPQKTRPVVSHLVSPWQPHSRGRSLCVQSYDGYEYNWLVVYLPLWKIWKSVGMMTFPIYGKKHVPTHQPDNAGPLNVMWMLVHNG